MPRSLQRSIAAAQLAAIIALGAYVVHTLVPDGGEVARLFDDRLYYALVACAAALVIARAVLVPLHRGAWIALALAVTSFATAEFLWQVLYADVSEAPYPSVADAFYLAFYPLSYAGLILLFRGRATSLTPGVWADGITAALAVAALGSAVVVETVLDTTEGSRSVVVTNLAYPLGDVLLLSLVVGAFALTRWRPGRAWVLLGASLAISALADSVYLYTTATGSYRDGTLLDAAWPAALLLIAFAGWQDTVRPRALDLRGRPLFAVPAACSAVAVGVLVFDHFQRVNLLAVVLATLAIVGVLARLALTFRENGKLLELTQHEAVTDLLTGIGNRRRLMTDLELVLEDASPARPWLLAIFDLDGFKSYNDTFGHPAGDALLARLGAKLALVPGSDGGAYRLGGDEFCLLAPAGAAQAGHLLDASVDALTEYGEGFEVTSSFGAVILPDEAADGSSALRIADGRLYTQKRSKHSARDRPQEMLLQALFEREPELHSHLHGVAALADEVGRALGLDDAALEELSRAAMLHDIGKIAIPDQILHKAGPLDEDEWRFVRQHTVVGERILGASLALRPIGRIVRATHERWDGTGYPDGLSGNDIPIEARIVFACDAYEAMTADRPHRPALDEAAALRELDRCAGTQFDRRVATALASAVRERSRRATAA
ncbi:MAG: HD domain-containing phosphohydrolase [Gaiellaceae bacterium]